MTDSVLRENNQSIRYEYDSFNRLVLIDYPNLEDTVYAYGASAEHGLAGRLKQRTDPSGSIAFEYRKLGETTKETKSLKSEIEKYTTGTITNIFEYKSNYLGQTEEIVYPDGEAVRYSYDKAGQVSSVTGTLPDGETFDYVKDIAYDEYGQRAYMEYGNGVRTEYSYNPQRRWLNSLKSTTDNGFLLQNLDYEFDKAGNVLSYTNDCLSNGYGSVTQEYRYDSLYQLVNAKGDYKYSKSRDGYIDRTSSYEQSFSYDKIGNLTEKKSQGEEVQNTKTDGLNYDFSYEYDQDYNHRLKRVGDSYFQYDANGNITAISDTSFDPQYDFAAHRISSTEWYYNYDITDPSSVPEKARGFNYQRNLQYDDRGMMSYSNGSSDINTKYLYDEDRNRTLKYDNTHDIEYLTFNDFYSVLINHNNRFTGGQIQKSIMLGNQRLVTRIDQKAESTKNWKDERTFYYLSDHLNSATLITDYKGDIFQSTEYTPYGERWVERTRKTSSDYYIHFRFTGKPLDTETGYYYFGARYYDPRLSVWTTSDPAMADYFDNANKGEGGVFNHINLNTYHYAGNNPVKYVDPDGEFLLTACLIGLAIGAVVGAGMDYGKQVISNRAEGKGWGDSFTDIDAKSVISSGIGGSASGAVLALTGNGALAGAVGGAAGNLANQILEIATGEKELKDFDFVDLAVDTGISTAFGAVLTGPSVKGINVGRNSMTAITKSTMTKLANGTIKNVSVKTSAKIAFSRCWNGALATGTGFGLVYGELGDDVQSNVRNYVEKPNIIESDI